MKTVFALLAILLQTPVPATYSISGRVVGFSDSAGTPSTVLLLRSYALHEGPGQGKTYTIHADGTFEFRDVPAGEFDLNFYDARQPFQQVGQTSAGQPVSRFTDIGPGLNFTFSGHNVPDLQIKSPAGLNGQFVMADGGPMPAVVVTSSSPLSVNSTFRSGRSIRSQAVPRSDARFTLGVFPGENTITVTAPGDMSGSRPLPDGYSVKSITYAAVDVMTNGLVLTGLPTSNLVITLDRQPSR